MWFRNVHTIDIQYNEVRQVCGLEMFIQYTEICQVFDLEMFIQ